MAVAMIIALFTSCVCLSLLTPSYQQEAPSKIIDAEDFVLNLHYDHCRQPMKFSWRKLKCECPTPLVRRGKECVCDNCIFEDVQQWFSEGMSSDLPNYINEVFEEIDGEIQDSEKNDNKTDENIETKDEIPLPKLENAEIANIELVKQETEETMIPEQFTIDEDDVEHDHFEETRRRKRSVEDERKYSLTFEPLIINIQGSMFVMRPTLPQPMPTWMQRVWNRWYNYNEREEPEEEEDMSSGRRFSNRGRILWRMPRPMADELTLPEHRIFFPRSRVAMDHRGKKVLRLKGSGRPIAPPQTFSDTAISGSIAGAIQSGLERAQGAATVYRGTSAVTLGADDTGSAGSAAITGIGSSALELKGNGASAQGQAWIGEKAEKGSSTTSILSGSGDAIAVNSLGEKGSASAAAISTKKTASGATTAFGPASASVSATPGKGDTSSSATFNEGLNTAAAVTAEGGPVVESSAVGDVHQDINKIERSDPFETEPILIEPVEMNFGHIFNP